jgi:hypothetical protein
MKSYKYVFALLLSLSCLTGLLGQTNKKTLNYQAVILDPKAIDIPGASIVGQPLNNGNVCLRFSLLNAQGGLDYEETQQVTTDEYGLVNVAIGTGSQAQASNSTSIYKSFESVVWNSSVKSLKVSVSYDGCSSFKQVSAQALNYTPYALYAEAVDYKNVREAPTKLSQFNNDAGYLIPKDLDPLKSDIQTNSSKIEVANKSIADNKQASDATFLVVNQSISSLDTQVAANTTAIKENTGSISNINTKITDQQNQISDNRNQITATNNNLNTQIGGLQGQLNTTNSTVNSLSGVAEVVSNKSTAVDLGGTNPSDQAYPSQKAAKAYVDQVVSQIATTGVPDATTLAAGKIQLSGDLGGTATSPTVPALAGKENSSNKTTATDLGAGNPSDQLYPSQKATKAYVDNSIYAAVGTGVPDATTNAAGKVKLAGDLAGTAAIPLVAKIQGSPVSSTTPTTGQVLTYNGTSWAPAAAGSSNKEDVSNKSDGALGTSTTLYPTQNAVKTYVDAQIASATIADADTNTKGKIQLAGDLSGSAAAPEITTGAVTSAKILDATIATADLADASVTDAKIVGLAASKVTGTVGITNGGTGATSAGDALTALGAAPLASPTFTGTVTAPIYASAPQSLTDAATISWNPANGLNASVTLGGNRTLSFASPPAAGSYGTLVISQDGTGGRTLTLPVTSNMVLGSTSTTTIALSTAAYAKDILNFYYDGTNCYWNIGQGYGTAATVAATNLASSVTGTLPVANGGTGATSAGDALTALGAAPLASPTFTGTVSGITATMVGLGNVTNKSEQDLAISTATATALSNKENSSNKSDDTALGNSTTLYPTQNAVKTYVNAQVSSGAPDADVNTKGKIQLAGDLAGSATSPSVVKLRGTALSTVAPVTGGHVLTYDASGSGVAYWAAPANSANTISGVVPVANGGTGLSSVTSGGAVYATSSNALATGTLPFTAGGTGAISQQTAINALTGTQSAGKYLRSNGTDATLSTIQAADVPTLNQNTTGTAANVSGTVAVSNGGTGAATLTENNVLLGNGTSALQTVAPGANGNVLTSNGTTWSSTAPSTSATTFSGSLTGDVTGTQSATVVGRINGVSLSGLNTGLLKNTTGTGAPSIASAGTDYSAGTSALGTGILKSTTTTGVLSIASASDFPTLNQNTTGNAATATKLATSRTINGTGFDGSANITVTADASTLTGTALKSTVVSSSLTSVGTLANLSVTNDLTANGVTMGRGNNSRANNYAFGYQALLSVSSTGGGNYNNAFGHQALTANMTGQQNSAFGEYVLPKNVGGSNNTAMGTQALRENTSGNYNTGFGHTALTTNTTGSNNTAIGYQADVSSDNLTNATAIGNGAKVATSNTIQLGNTDVTNVKTSGTLTLKDVTYPNSHNTTAGQVLTINATGTASWATPTSSGSGSGGHYVGEVYGGGIVFYVTAGGYHGLIASSTDISGDPITLIDKATSPDYHTSTTNDENLYVDWKAPTFSQLSLLRNARNTPGLNINAGSVYVSSTGNPNDPFQIKVLKLSTGDIYYVNFNWTEWSGGIVIRSIRTF